MLPKSNKGETMEISTSILSADRENAIQTFYNIEVAKTDYFHIDVMDGKFVEKNTLEYMKESAQTIKHISNVPLDVHLMVENPIEHIDDYISLKPGFITIHAESNGYVEAIKKIKESEIKAGISIKPHTDISQIIDVLPKVSLVLIMTVEPGLGGQKLIKETIDKIKKIYEYREENNLDYYIEADGGINLETIDIVKDAGVDIAVCGSAIINSNDMSETIKQLKK